MSISTAATATPIPKPNSVAAFVEQPVAGDLNPRGLPGALNEHGLAILNALRNYVVGMNRITPCNASGTNVITLTPLDASPLIEKYVDYEVYSFVAANDSTGSVTMTIVPRDGTLSTLKLYKDNGGTQAGASDVLAGRHYTATYVDSLDSGTGGFVLR